MSGIVSLFSDFEYKTEVEDVAKLFFTVVLSPSSSAEIVNVTSEENGVFRSECRFSGSVDVQTVSLPDDNLMAIRLKKRYAKISVYNCLVKATGRTQPWGCLTGIRPTKLAVQLAERERADYRDVFKNSFGVSDAKIKLVEKILSQQQGLIDYDDSAVDLYVGIPFCVSRCSYCSFTSGEIGKLKCYVEPYVAALCREIDETLQFAAENHLTFKNVYIGGGTPTSLSVEQLSKILSHVSLSPKEFTVEAGRPDTVDAEKFAEMKSFGVNRISLNPQTFNQSTLDAIGRRHSVLEIYDKYRIARNYPFAINMDLIAGLPGENLRDFAESVHCAVELSPENITVHTLALKKGSVLKENCYAPSSDVSKMVDFAYNMLEKAGYYPYYMYRQKYMSDNLENVGFCKKDKQCLYNIDNMEETTSILACGANAISKRIIGGQNRIERFANPKDVATYLSRLDEFILRKKQLFLQ